MLGPSTGQPTIERDLERLRPALTGYCYRMLGSGFEAEDATQETLLRAWRRSDTPGRAGRAEVLAVPDRDQRLPRPDRRPQAPRPPGRPRRPRHRRHRRSARRCRRRPGSCRSPAARSPTPTPTRRRRPPSASRCGSPSSPRCSTCRRASASSSSCARCCAGAPRRSPTLLETSVASVNSALQRARATLDELDLEDADAPARPSDEDERRLLEQYLEAFAEYDIDRIVALLRYDVVFDMPPLPLWVRGPEQVGALHARPGRRLPRLEADRPLGQRLPRLRRLQARPRVRRLAPLVADPARAERRRRRRARPSPASTTSSPPFMPNLFARFGLPERLEDADPVRRGSAPRPVSLCSTRRSCRRTGPWCRPAASS